MTNTVPSRRDFITTAGKAAAALTVAGCARGARPGGATGRTGRPNIVFIVVDDMGYADLGCYGSKAVQTPRIDRMAAEGMRFTQAYSGCTVCAPARSTLMTGRHMGHTSVRGNTGGIPLLESDMTVAQVLKKAGYATGGFGKWGLGDIDTPGVPERHGFDTFFGYYHQVHAHYYYPEYLIHNGKKVPLPGNAKKPLKDYSHYRIFEEMVTFIRENRDRPFFCYAPWTPPHGKYEIPASEPAVAPYKDRDWPRDAKVVAAMESMVDRNVGQVLDLLDELGLAEDTIVFFCSDNGASERFEGSLDSSGPLRGRKRAMYEGGIRTPMVVRWPGRIAPGTVSDLPWYFPDVMPTLADLAGAEQHLPDGIDGLSVVPTLTGKGRQEMHDGLYWEWALYDWGKHAYVPNGLMQAVRSGRWKLVRHRQDEPWELYDLDADVGETKDLAQAHPDVVARLSDWVTLNRAKPRPQIEPVMPEGKRFR